MEHQIKTALLAHAIDLFGSTIDPQMIQFQRTHKHVLGDLTLIAFPFAKYMRCSPTQAGEKIGTFLMQHIDEIEQFELVGGFINLIVADTYWIDCLQKHYADDRLGLEVENSKPLVMVEYASPNTNKPLHLGHLRNIFLGDSVANILCASGHQVVRTQIINDRGIHICKSMIAWLNYSPINEFGERETPESTGLKGDKFVGKYYVEFDKQLQSQTKALLIRWHNDDFANCLPEQKEEITQLIRAKTDKDSKTTLAIDEKLKEFAKNQTPLMQQAKELLLLWENNDIETIRLWKKMNAWVYQGFDVTYKSIRVTFDQLYYESDTFHYGKKVVAEGQQKNVFYQKEDQSVWIDLRNEGLDEKIVLRSDGTSVYITQDIGTAIQRFVDFPQLNGIVYTVGNEQDYHFKVLFLILEKLGYQWAKNCYHLSYGMVDLPEGKMKSREGTVIDADDIIDEVIEKATQSTLQRGHIEELSDRDVEQLCKLIGVGGLKYFLLKIDPKKRIVFNPAESVELNGNTAPFIQYAHARIQTLLAKSTQQLVPLQVNTMLEIEKDIIKTISLFPRKIVEAANNYSPALIANYVYDLVKLYNHFYQTTPILKETDPAVCNFRLTLSATTGKVIKTAMRLLGIEVPNRM